MIESSDIASFTPKHQIRTGRAIKPPPMPATPETVNPTREASMTATILNVSSNKRSYLALFESTNLLDDEVGRSDY